MKHHARIVVTQPYVANYRLPLWEAIARRLDDVGVELIVLSGSPAGDQAGRRDAATAPWVKSFPSRTLRVFRRQVQIRPYPHLERNDLLITELAATNVVAWIAMVLRPSQTVLWGHARSYVESPTKAGRLAKTMLVKRAARIMTYTEQGRRYAINSLGAAEHKVVAIGNSTDTKSLTAAFNQITPNEAIAIKQKWQAHGPTAMYVGGLDRAKRIDFLAQAADEAFALDATFRLLVAGDGVDRNHLFKGSRPQYIKYLGVADSKLLAQMASAATAIWMPGRVGLVAIDALALEIPVHTTSSRFHAPEIDFLEEGTSLYLHPDNAAQFAAQALRTMNSQRPYTPSEFPTIDSVSNLFVRTVLSLDAERGERTNSA